MNLSGLVHVNVNCSDFERSRAFYEALGFRVVWPVPEVGSAELGAAVGMGPYRLRGALMAGPGGFVIDLLEWREPRDEAPPYPHLYHLGIARIALSTTDLAADVAELERMGVPFVSEPVRLQGPGGVSVRFVCFLDPDGTVLELVEQGASEPALV